MNACGPFVDMRVMKLVDPTIIDKPNATKYANESRRVV